MIIAINKENEETKKLLKEEKEKLKKEHDALVKEFREIFMRNKLVTCMHDCIEFLLDEGEVDIENQKIIKTLESKNFSKNNFYSAVLEISEIKGVQTTE